MIICFDCSADTKRTLDSLLQSGQYEDYSEIISVAVANLAVLQDQVIKSGGLVIGSEAGMDMQTSRDSGRSRKQSPPDDSKPVTIPAIFRLAGLTDSTPTLAHPPDDMWVAGEEIPLDRWIFGQYNRLLPAKASSRALAHMLLRELNGVLLEEAAEQIAQEAAVLAEFLTHHDQQNDIGRDQRLSTAFPSADKDASLQRYASQFVASVSGQGQLSGLLVDLKLINSSGVGKTRLMLTETGWRLATMPNPILDGTQKTPTQKFSVDERRFLLNHIAKSVPVEDFAYRAILSAIGKGANTPDTVDSALRKYIPQGAEESLSQSFLSSQRSGAVSRMTDLGLVERVRDGVRVSYVMTDFGREYMDQRKNQEVVR